MLEKEKFTLVKQGAEARLYVGEFFGRPTLVKERFPKAYRHPALDRQLTTERLKSEARALVRCRGLGIRTPALYFVDPAAGAIYMEYLKPARTLREHIQAVQARWPDAFTERLTPLALEVGHALARLHENDIVHGDLTTSNMLVMPRRGREVVPEEEVGQELDEAEKAVPAGDGEGPSSVACTGSGPSTAGGSSNDVADAGEINQDVEEQKLELVMIDFGLSYGETGAEDKGVDLYVLERAMLSTHPRTEALFCEMMQAYKAAHTNPARAKAVLSKLAEVRMRGRKRTMVG